MSGSRRTMEVVTLTWNDGERLRQSVADTLSSEGLDLRVIVVDNGSMVAPLVPEDGRVRVLRNLLNRGVRARNQGVAPVGSEYVAFVDSDACVHPDTLSKLASVLDQNPDVGIAVPVFDGQAPEESAGSAPTFGRKLVRLVGLTRSYRTDRAAGAATWDVDFAISACWLFRREVFLALGGLDERYFYGPEDLDFCLRARVAGWRIVQVAEAGCDHPPRRRFRSPLSRAGLRHASAVVRHLWRHRRFRALVAGVHPR